MGLTLTILYDLYRIYESRGFAISSGLNPYHFMNKMEVPFTHHFKDGRPVTGGLGLSLQEIYFLECLHGLYQAKRVFVIGNALGWSTLALALLNAQARIVAIDSGMDRNALLGLDFTNKVAGEEGLDVRAVKGKSPDDVSRVMAEEFDGPVDLVLVDGYHTSAQAVVDFEAIEPHLAEPCIVLFHDIITFRMLPGLRKIMSRSALESRVLCATPSGMAILYSKGLEDQVAPAVHIFGGNRGAVGGLLRDRYRELRKTYGDEDSRFMSKHLRETSAMIELFAESTAPDARAFYQELKEIFK